ncbi:hypothetical protein BGW36DRAFT_353999 [Talaromyces proteolyticus]|uniref:PHD-type domain-containing protein n=1 Tax=Talaromyces proteolyticus TaxID=1131652 RepID=A0AAD4Q6F7_9EURO|nr:uncharacterized protein BGW36DRAFT_353999 [Talaromyces proteolyticus]KAH8705598.1 hypothetical protein BGW36DRAFT_353999 [Talaromyces proteolyticus]
MPRTRTKFIWPPPNLARDPATNTAGASPAEPRPKKPKLEEQQSSSQNTPNDFGHSTREHMDSPALSDGRVEDLIEKVTWDPASGVARPSLEVLVDAYSKIPIESQIKSYQNWRRHGSVHDDYCMTCNRPRTQSLVPCYTCRRSFHDDCMPAGSLYNEQRQWFCLVCVQRNWHVEPPTVTPPASPPSSQNILTTGNADYQVSHSSGTPTNDTTAEDSQAISILAGISRSVSSQPHPPTSTALNYIRNSSPYTSSSSTPKPAPRSGSLSTTRRNDLPMPSTSTNQSFSMLDSHARKSRFATLSSEVDSALWVLYRELESATSLRQRIDELEAEVVKLRQDVRIRDNQIKLSQRSAQAVQPVNVSQAEVTQLREQAAKGEAAAHEIDRLRARNDTLERELRDARTECSSKDETLNEWRGRLASLIGP